MLTVKTPAQVEQILREHVRLSPGTEIIEIHHALGRILAETIIAREYVPDFNRSTVDGFAVKSTDTFGCLEALPALLEKAGEVRMGVSAGKALRSGTCVYVPTGGEVPDGADAVVMIEYTEDYGDGIIGMLRPCAPGENMIYRGDDLAPGQVVLQEGTRLRPQDIGALSTLGIQKVKVRKKVKAAVLSTGDELIPADQTPKPGQIRDVNSALLEALLHDACAQPVSFGILPDREEEIRRALHEAAETCDLVLISGGSSVGTRDLTCRLLEESGEVIFHGISMKPGKPTIFGLLDSQSGKKVPVFGLPGHPGAAFFVAQIFIRPILRKTAGLTPEQKMTAFLTENVSANHGRAQYMAVFLQEREGEIYARPVHTKSGLITSLAGAHGYFCIPEGAEGMQAGTQITVMQF